MLVRSSLSALNHANKTGNYTVIRDLASPAFRQSNTAAKLGLIFLTLRDARYDLSPVLLLEPVYSAPPNVDAKGVLTLTGHFPTRPLAVRFDLRFQVVSGNWKLAGIAVQPAKVAAVVPKKQ